MKKCSNWSLLFFRQSALAGDLDRANEEIARLRKLLKRPPGNGNDGYVAVHQSLGTDRPPVYVMDVNS